MLTEITHRVNNELAAAIAIARSEIARAGSEEIQLSLLRVKRSLEGFARVHQVLRVPDLRTRMDACPYLRALCAAISRARLEPLGIDLSYVERPLRLDSERCWRLGIIITELVTNASRHAFGGGSGTIVIEASRAASTVQCIVSDNGGTSQPRSRGLGLRIVEALLQDLEGRLELEIDAEGSKFTVSFPDPAA